MIQQNKKQKLKFDSPQDILSSQKFIKLATIQNIRKTIQRDPKIAYSLIIAYLFRSYQAFKKLEEEWDLMPKGLCGRVITTGHQVYKCVDCGDKNDYHIFCKQCFEEGFFQGKHKGHRYKAKSDGSGCCDCGDIEGLKPQGFCSKHKGTTICKTKLDQQLGQRLRILLFDIINVLFETAEQKSSSSSMNPVTFQIQNKTTRNEQQTQLSLKHIFQTLFQFVGQFCKNKLPLQFAISRIILQPINQQRIHFCQTTCPIFFLVHRKKHMCNQSIASLLLRFSFIFEHYHNQISGILYSLFSDQIFKETLSHIYLKDFNFFCICFDYKTGSPPLIKAIKISEMYFQFFGQKYASILIKSPYFSNFTNSFKNVYTFMNGKHYKKIYNGTQDFNNILNGLVDLCQQFKNQMLCLKLIQEIISISYATNVSKAISYDHHKHKIYLISGLLNFVQKLCSCIKYQQDNVKQSQFKLIQKFFNNELSNKDQKQQQQQQQQLEREIKIEWQCLPELCIGNLILVFYCHFGKQQTRKLICTDKKGIFIKQYIRKILKAQTEAYKLSKSNQVGFPNQILPKNLYKQLYKKPSEFIFDSLIALLQILALVVPEYFIQQLSLLKLNNIIQFLSDIVLEQSCFINAGANCNIKSDLIKNAVQIQIINFLNMKNKRTFKQLKEAYFQKMFSQQVQTRFALKQVADFDQKSQIFSIKEQYKNLTQAILIQRLDKDFGQFFEQQSSPQLKLLKKDNLFNYQKQNQKQTICYLLTEQITKSKHFEEIFNFCFAEIWKQKQSIQNYEHVKLISTIYLRSSNRKSMQNTIEKYIGQTNKTYIQKLIFEVFNTMNQSEPTKMIEQEPIQINKKVNRMKVHLQKMKKQQQKFITNNQDLVSEAKQNTQKTFQQQSYQTCLICHQQQDKGQCSGFILLLQNIIIQQKYVTQYLSCGHTFHRNCLNIQKLCPLCKHPFNNMFSYNSDNKISFLNPQNSNTLLNQDLDIKGSFTYPLSLNQIIQMINHRVYFSIFDTCTKFIEKDYQQLRVLYYHFISQKQSKAFVGQIDQKCKNLLSFDVEPNQRKNIYLGLLQTLLLIPLFKNSLETKKLFEELISNIFTKFWACNFLCFVNNTEISQDNVDILFKQYEEALKSQMNEFCQGIIFVYAILFDDKRNVVISSFTNDDVVKGIIITNYPQLFVVDKIVFSDYIKKYKSATIFIHKTYQSLMSIPTTIIMPKNYMQFHEQYKNLICDQCDGIANVFKNRSWMCLLCGYKSCSIKCPKSQQPAIFNLIVNHLDTQHSSQGILIDLNTSLVCIVNQKIFFEYGFIYANQFGQHNSDEIKDWTSLNLQTLKWNKLIQLLQKRTLAIYLTQNKLKKHFAVR